MLALQKKLGAVLLSAIFLSVAFGCATMLPRPTAAANANREIYSDALTSDWQDWSWDTTADGSTTTPVHSGSKSYAITHTAAWASFYLHADPAISSAGYTTLRFWLHGGVLGGQKINVSANADTSHAFAVTAAVNAWKQIDIPLASLNNPATLSDLYWQDATGGAQDTYYLDDIQLLGEGASASTLPDPIADVAINGLDHPAGVGIAPNGRVYVAIWGNDGNDGQPFRQGSIQSWPNVSALANNQAADIVLGQAGAIQVGNPEALAIDSDNRLYVADTYNHRVLVFNSVNASGQQPDFVFGAQGTSNQLENKFQFTRGLAIDSQQHLFVTDEFNHRVLVYNLPIVSNTPPPLAQFGGLKGPRAVAVDRQDNVYIADSQHGQVKRFDQPVTTNHYTNPDQTFGQLHDSDCNATGAQTAADYLSCPIDVVLDAAGNLLVADTPNHRVLGYPAGQSAPTAIYGQADFTGYLANRGGALGNATLSSPLGMDFDATGKLYLADFDNGRLLIFNPSEAPNPNTLVLTVDAAANRHPISELIYGMHYVADEQFAQEISLPIRRWGGNNTTRYNWKLGATNHASDWYFHNNTTYDAITGAGLDADQWLQRNQRTHTRSLLTIPMTGYVAKDGDQNTCSFPVSKYPGQDDVDDEDGFPNCGNGLKNGAPIKADPLDTSIAVDENFAGEWVQHLQQNAASNGAVEFYDLDNEPDIWFETHRDIYPVGWKYDQFRDLTYRYAAKIKETDPNAQLLGPVVNGWTYYFQGSFDGQNQDWASPDDRNAHGGTPFVEWYLQQMKAYADQHGVRLLDYLDLHYYPQSRNGAPAINLAPAGDAATQARRLRSTRSLWDSTYADESWIADAGPDGGIIQLLPRMKAWVNQNYPGTKLAITEYNWGGLESINGALAQADVLGIFGREGLDLATFFDPGQGDPLQTTFPSSPGAFAFRMFRNYDGNGAKFGNTSIAASSSNQEQLAIYAAERTSDGSLTLLIINKTGDALTANVTLNGVTPNGSAQLFRYAADTLTAITRPPDQPIGATGFSTTFPANSITMVVVPSDHQPTGLNKAIFLPAMQR